MFERTSELSVLTRKARMLSGRLLANDYIPCPRSIPDLCGTWQPHHHSATILQAFAESDWCLAVIEIK